PVRGVGRQVDSGSAQCGDVRHRGRGVGFCVGPTTRAPQTRHIFAVVPALSRDPYRVISVVAHSACCRHCDDIERPVVMGPRLRGDDTSFVVAALNNNSTLQNISGTIVLAGAGKMGGAMLAGWLAQGLDPRRVVVIEPAPSEEIGALAGRGVRLNPQRTITADTLV